MKHPVSGALKFHFGESANDLATFIGTGNRMTLMQIFAYKERIDFGRISAQRDLLIAVGKDLCLNEMTWRQSFGDRASYAHVVERAAPERIDIMASQAVIIEGLSKKFPTPAGLGKFTVIESLSLEIARGSFASIVGPSGCGKSTLLNIIAGIESRDGGRVQILSQDGANSAARIGYVFQSPRLLNWLTVENNIKFALEAQNIERSEWGGRVRKYLDMVGLAGQERNFPLNLSGGMTAARFSDGMSISRSAAEVGRSSPSRMTPPRSMAHIAPLP